MSGCWQRRLVPTLFAYQRVAGHGSGIIRAAATSRYCRHLYPVSAAVTPRCTAWVVQPGREEAAAAPALIDQCRLLAGRGQKTDRN